MGTQGQPSAPSPQDTLIDAWSMRCPEARQIISDELGTVRKIKRPDNFLGKDLADAVAVAYVKLAAIAGAEPNEDAAKIEREIYRALCRDAHACIRLQPRGLKIDSDGFVEVIRQEREVSAVADTIVAHLRPILGDAITALSFRIAAREVAALKATAAAARDYEAQVRPEFRRDFGLHLLERSLAHAKQAFPAVLLHNIGVMPDSTVTTSTTIEVEGETLMATFDFKGQCADQILKLLRDAYGEGAIPERGSGEHRVSHLPAPFTVSLVASVGAFQHNEGDKFVPLLVSKVF